MPITSQEFEADMVSDKQMLDSIIAEPGVMLRISPFGFKLERLQAGLVIRNEANGIYMTLISKRGEQVNLRILLDKMFADLLGKYRVFASNLKIHFYDSLNVIRDLGIDGETKRTIPTFIPQSTNSYSNLKKKQKHLDQVVDLGITAETLQADLDEIAELESLHAQHQFLIGHCQRLTEDRDRKHAELKRFLRQLKNVLFLVYPPGERQILEQHGIFVRNKPILKKPSEEPTEPPIPSDPPDDTLQSTTQPESTEDIKPSEPMEN
ncbi:MAG: hypothetical protein GY940_18940, partial [bacterium]|nr:hypothetical protein [bacterium]